jgi:prepilin-type N-terminal cleavage/methylation domain-containing protein
MLKVNNNRKAFSLVELSVVLAVISFIVAVVIGGAVLKKAARIKLIIAEVQEVKAMTKQFEMNFNYLPGDFPDAGSLWGNDCDGSSSGSDLCSGDGDGEIDHINSSSNKEPHTFWQHLKKAKIINNTYTIAPNGSAPFTTSSNAYPSKIVKEGLYYPQYPVTDSSTAALSGFLSSDLTVKWFHSKHANKNLFLFGAQPLNTSTSGGYQASGPLFYPRDVYLIDKKIDDSRPLTGIIKGVTYSSAANGWQGTTSTSSNECESYGNVTNKTDAELLASVYNVDLKVKECIMLFDME